MIAPPPAPLAAPAIAIIAGAATVLTPAASDGRGGRRASRARAGSRALCDAARTQAVAGAA